MSTSVVPAFVGARGFDTVASISASLASSMKAAGMDFAVRYLGGLTAVEVQNILSAGLGLMAVGYSRAPGWIPSGAIGSQDGNAAIAHAQAAGILVGTTLWCDLEGVGGDIPSTMAYVNAWGNAVKTAGFIPGLYVGAGQPLNAQQLYSLSVTRYWHSLSKGMPEPSCGFCMYQLHPTTTWCGISVDVDVIQADFQSRLPTWMIGQ